LADWWRNFFILPYLLPTLTDIKYFLDTAI